MPLNSKYASNLDRAFSSIKSLNELDQQAIRNVVEGILNPTLLEIYFRLNYHRAVINIELLLTPTLAHTKQFQAINMLTRSIFETAVELKLLATLPGAAAKAQIFAELEKLEAAAKLLPSRMRIQRQEST